MKKILSLALVLVFAASSMGISAYAADSDDNEIKNVRVYSPSYTVRVDKTLQLEERVYPSDADYDHVEWYSDDEDIAWVDEDDGEVTGVAPGKATVTVRIFDENDKRLASGNTEITVTGRSTYGGSDDNNDSDDQLDRDDEEAYDNDDDDVTPSQPGSGTSSASQANKGGQIASATVLNSVKQTVARGRTTNSIFRGYKSIAASTLKSAAAEMQKAGGTVLLNFDTMSAAKANSVEGRVTINPRTITSGLTGDVQLGVYTNEGDTGATRRKFEHFFKNRVVIIKAAQKGSYGTSVSYAVKIGTELANSRNLKLYTYRPATNKFAEIKNSNIWIDTKGYVHFSTLYGDDLVIADGALATR